LPESFNLFVPLGEWLLAIKLKSQTDCKNLIRRIESAW
jgi:hypothetical protein